MKTNKKQVFLWLPILVCVAGVGVAATFAEGAPDLKGMPWTDSDGPRTIENFQPPTSLAPLVDVVRPAVVNIYTTQKNVVPKFRWNVPPGFEDFFSPFGDEHDREIERNSLGTGFLLNSDGLVATNHHVVANSTDIRVRTHTGDEFDARLVGADPKTDLALLKIETSAPFPHVVLGDSDALKPGDWVVAIGQPLGLQETVTVGIVSGKGRVIGSSPYDDFIQTDASINPGNSGGPLFNTNGEVVGINTAIVRGAPGIGFAIPVNLARSVMRQLLNDGKVSRGWLGVGIQAVDERLAQALNSGKTKGVVVTQVFPGSPADTAGLKVGDIIVRVGTQPIRAVTDVTKSIASQAPGTNVEIEYLRTGNRAVVSVSLSERTVDDSPASAPAKSGEERPGEQRSSPSRSLGIKLAGSDGRSRATDDSGVGVEWVQPRSRAERAGIAPGDKILEVDRLPVRSHSEVDQRIASHGNSGQVLFLVERRSQRVFVAVPLDANDSTSGDK